MNSSPLIVHRTSLIEQTTGALRDALNRKIWTGEMPGERELCLRFHISRPTLRAALQILEREGWLQSQHGKKRVIVSPQSPFKKARLKVVALLSPVPLSEIVPHSSIWTNRLREFLAEEGLDLQVHTGRHWWHTKAAEKQVALLTHQNPAAVWVLFSGTERLQQWFANSSLISVAAGSVHGGIGLPSVDLNHRATCRHAAGQFLSHGHERVVFLKRAPSAAGDLESEQGFLEAFRLKQNVSPMIEEHDGTPDGIRRILSTIQRRKSPPTGFLLTHATTALLTASTLIQRGVRIPQDVSMICRDSDGFLDYFCPSIARYEVDSRFHAQRLGRLILQLANGGAVRTQRVLLVPKFFPGESLAAI
jgi:LacI family transcriptional regulator